MPSGGGFLHYFRFYEYFMVPLAILIPIASASVVLRGTAIPTLLLVAVFGFLYFALYVLPERQLSGGAAFSGVVAHFVFTAIDPFDAEEPSLMSLVAVSVLLYSIIPLGLLLAILAIGSTAQVTRRLLFLCVGLTLLIGLNQLSHYAPDIRALLKAPM